MPQKLDNCVADLIAQGRSEDSAWAICRAALGEGEYPNDTSDQDKATAIATLGESKGLREAGNIGVWLEAELHRTLVNLVDSLYSEGSLTRQEQMVSCAGLDRALEAFIDHVKKEAPGLYERRPFDQVPEDEEEQPLIGTESEEPEGVQLELVTEAALIESGTEAKTGKLIEAALRRDNTVGIKIIEPGWGSSGFYPAAVLERDGPQVFTKGVQMFWDHATMTEEAERPEGSLNDLAAELISDARWVEDHPSGPGLYADAQVFGPYQEAVNELAGHIGVSIRAEGEAQQGTAEGRMGPIIQRFTNAKSVDFVTKAGAGGEILQLFESARQRARNKEGIVMDQQNPEMAQLVERQAKMEQENARLRESLILRDAKDVIARQLQESQLPDMVRSRLMNTLVGNPPITETGDLDMEGLSTRIKEAVDSELQYLQSVLGNHSPVHGMGNPSPDNQGAPDYNASLEESFRILTGSDSMAKIAATGR